MSLSPARKTVFEILCLVEQGGYASELLRYRSEGLDPRDAALASEIVLGVLRFQGQLDYLIEYFAGRRVRRLDREVRIALRMGIYQIRYLERVPLHAVVDQSVELVKRSRKKFASGLVNAVLRKCGRAPVAWPDDSTELSLPEWLLDNWTRMFGAEGAATIARAFLRPPERYIRVPERRRADGEALNLAPTAVQGCFRVLGGSAGDFRQQDIGSQAVVELLELERGQQFLDLAAAPGNKTAQALEAGVYAVACDIHFGKLRGLGGLDVPLVVADAAEPLPFTGRFDRILVDAPCSGTGTLGRNPEIKWRLEPEALGVHHARQVQMLKAAMAVLAPGGRLVYSTCSLEHEENEAVVEAALESAPAEVELERMMRRIPGVDAGDGFFAAVLTSR